MAEEYDRMASAADKAAKTAKTLATIALILSLIALAWAIKADRQAADAMKKANQAMNSGAIVRLLER